MAFMKSWHRFALGVFVACWATMLLPLLLLPDSDGAKSLTLSLLGLGGSAVQTLVFTLLLGSANRCGKNHEISLKQNRSEPCGLSDGAKQSE